jgi:hypothetical protein
MALSRFETVINALWHGTRAIGTVVQVLLSREYADVWLYPRGCALGAFVNLNKKPRCSFVDCSVFGDSLDFLVHDCDVGTSHLNNRHLWLASMISARTGLQCCEMRAVPALFPSFKLVIHMIISITISDLRHWLEKSLYAADGSLCQQRGRDVVSRCYQLHDTALQCRDTGPGAMLDEPNTPPDCVWKMAFDKSSL